MTIRRRTRPACRARFNPPPTRAGPTSLDGGRPAGGSGRGGAPLWRPPRPPRGASPAADPQPFGPRPSQVLSERYQGARLPPRLRPPKLPLPTPPACCFDGWAPAPGPSAVLARCIGAPTCYIRLPTHAPCKLHVYVSRFVSLLQGAGRLQLTTEARSMAAGRSRSGCIMRSACVAASSRAPRLRRPFAPLQQPRQCSLTYNHSKRHINTVPCGYRLLGFDHGS